MPLLSSYRRVLATPGALLFWGTGLVARLPISMAGLGGVFLVHAGTGSYGVAGSVSAVYMFATAAMAIAQGRLIDTLGQRLVLNVASVAVGGATGVLIASVQADWPMVTSYLAAAVAGGTLPSVGSAVRARWTHVLTAPADLQTAYALEAVVDEAVYILGPIIVTVLATAIDPVVGLATAAVLGSLGSLAFAVQRRTEPPARPHDHTTGARPPMPWRTVLPLATVCAALGILFGAAEVTTVAFADEQGHKSYAGALLALWALGSLLAGGVTGAINWHRGPSFRLRVGALGMAAAMAPLYFVGSIPVMGVLLLIGGVAIAPTMIATMSLTQASVPPARLTEGMGIMQTGVIAGVAPGAALGGLVVDGHGASVPYLVSLAAGLLAAVAAQAIPRQRAATPSSSQPAPETSGAVT